MLRFALLYSAALVLPGWSLSRILGFREHPSYLVVALSLAWAVMCMLVVRTVGAGRDAFGMVYLGGLAVLAAWALAIGRYRKSPAGGIPGWWLPDWRAACLAGSLAALYAAWAGPYLEIPADALWHVGEIRRRLAAPAGDIWVPVPGTDVFSKWHGFWYLFFAWLCWWGGTDLNEALVAGNMVNLTLMAAAISQFSSFVLGRTALSPQTRRQAAFWAAVFFFAQFGLHIFAFVRYYTFGPVFLNYLVYLSIIVLFLSALDGHAPAGRAAVLIVLLLGVGALLHKQEGMLALVVMSLVIGVRFLRLHGNRLSAWWKAQPLPSGTASPLDGRQRRQTAVLFAGVTLGYLLLHAYLFFHAQRSYPLEGGRLYSIEHVIPFLRNLYILVPTFQLWQVITLWGVIVYVVYFYKRRLFAGNDFLSAGMILPVLTVLNPVFVDMFLRLSWPEVLWRVCYAVPLYVVGGGVMAYAIERAMQGPAVARLKAAFTICALIGALFPVESTYFANRESKWLTLKPVSPERDYRNWRDLIEFFEAHPGRRVLTDIVTGYMLKAHSPVDFQGYKFSRPTGFDVRKAHYEDSDFSPYRGALVVVNLRDGAMSETGRVGRHWPEDILKVSHAYGDAFLRYVEEHPERFVAIWRRDRITVYEVR